MSMTENNRITDCKGVGEKTAEAFRRMGVETVGQLLESLPLRYERYGVPIRISEAGTNQVVSVEAVLSSSPALKRGKIPLVSVQADDGDERFGLTWFHMPYLKNQLHKGDRRIFRGRVIRGRFGTGMEQAAVFREEDYRKLCGTLQPVYRTVPGISVGRLRKLTAQCLAELEPSEDFLPENVRVQYGLKDRRPALQEMHFPTDEAVVLEARRRLVFEEFLLFLLAIRGLKEGEESTPNSCPCRPGQSADKLLRNLPHQLTDAQKRVWSEIRTDLGGEFLMNRLVQGDVGSGKTILAVLAMLEAADNGYQSALMAPTEVLARQHYEKITDLFRRYDIPYRVLLLTGSMTAKEKREAYEQIESHQADLVIGTHALIQAGVQYHRLALVITDEQHRFGVHQREMFFEKGRSPHVLVMSATPIPRTLAIILYGDLDISVVDELPVNRTPIKNCVVDPGWRPKAYEFIREQIRGGRQAYVVCPKVEPDEDFDGENVVDYALKLREVLPPAIRVEYLHGKMRPAEKNRRMEAFAAGEIDVLVSTTVIEVGVDVPNASVMMIENADRFGLAQLHQLRGRVGRGSYQSYCIFINTSGDNEKQKRLEILNRSNDGFEIAAEDLKLRGPGDVFGIRQSGAMEFSVGDIYTDSRILQEASECADLLRRNTEEYPLLKQKIELFRKERLEHISL